jgi:hypothetical protein
MTDTKTETPSDTTAAKPAYEAPKIEVLGTVHELTLKKSGSGLDNSTKITT